MKILLSLFISSFIYIGLLGAATTHDGEGVCGQCSFYSQRDSYVAQASQLGDDFNPSQDIRR